MFGPFSLRHDALNQNGAKGAENGGKSKNENNSYQPEHILVDNIYNIFFRIDSSTHRPSAIIS